MHSIKRKDDFDHDHFEDFISFLFILFGKNFVKSVTEICKSILYLHI